LVKLPHPVSGKVIDTDLRFWYWELYQKIEDLIKLLLEQTNDFRYCFICSNFSPTFRKKSSLVLHWRLHPKHVIRYFIEKMKKEVVLF